MFKPKHKVFINPLEDGVVLINLLRKHNIDCDYRMINGNSYEIKIGKQRK